MFSFIRFRFAVLCTGLFLTACGGGGGGGRAMEAMNPTPIPPPSVEQQTAFGNPDQGSAPAVPTGSALFSAFQQATDPIFGSVVQSVGVGVSQVTGVDTTFTPDRFTLRLNRQNGASTVLDSDRDYAVVINEYAPSENLVTNRPAADGYMGRESGGVTTITAVSVEWSRTDPTDYLAGGYWVHGGIDAGIEIGAFIDGPAFDDVALTLPATGTATYTGLAGGGYVGLAGNDQVAPAGTFEQGEYSGSVSLTADFGTSQISGRIDNIGAYNVRTVYPNGLTDFNPYLTSTAYGVTLSPVSINQNGTFWGEGVIVTHPQVTITSSTGSWAGRFSNVDDSAGNPRAVAGTNAAYMATAGGSEAIFTGAFYGATERFE